ncbi:hypothetical protein BDF19DRAFT_300554 [Syncephalis fuscata]|nr:hypothetical protein BDF19DRAFT_300554 [Syncephalis fuscata]
MNRQQHRPGSRQPSHTGSHSGSHTGSNLGYDRSSAHSSSTPSFTDPSHSPSPPPSTITITPPPVKTPESRGPRRLDRSLRTSNNTSMTPSRTTPMRSSIHPPVHVSTQRDDYNNSMTRPSPPIVNSPNRYNNDDTRSNYNDRDIDTRSNIGFNDRNIDNSRYNNNYNNRNIDTRSNAGFNDRDFDTRSNVGYNGRNIDNSRYNNAYNDRNDDTRSNMGYNDRNNNNYNDRNIDTRSNYNDRNDNSRYNDYNDRNFNTRSNYNDRNVDTRSNVNYNDRDFDTRFNTGYNDRNVDTRSNMGYNDRNSNNYNDRNIDTRSNYNDRNDNSRVDTSRDPYSRDPAPQPSYNTATDQPYDYIGHDGLLENRFNDGSQYERNSRQHDKSVFDQDDNVPKWDMVSNINGAIARYIEHFMRLNNMELEEEENKMDMRIHQWGIHRLQEEGLVLLDMQGEMQSKLYSMHVIVFRPSRGRRLPYNNFMQGDMLKASRDLPTDECAWDMTVLNKTANELHVITRRPPPDLHEDVWRLDQAFSPIPYQRTEKALLSLCQTGTGSDVHERDRRRERQAQEQQDYESDRNYMKTVDNPRPLKKEGAAFIGTTLRDVLVASDTRALAAQPSGLFDNYPQMQEWLKGPADESEILRNSNLMNNHDRPPKETKALNRSQISAVKLALNNRFSLIVGPPDNS